jgi:prohibitin 1
MRTPQLNSFLTAVSRYSLLFGVGGSLLATSLYTVDGGERAVIFDRLSGVKKEVKGEGTHFLIPFIQKPIIFEVRMCFACCLSLTKLLKVRTQAHEVSSHTGSRDLQTVEVALRLLYRPDMNMLPEIFSK